MLQSSAAAAIVLRPYQQEAAARLTAELSDPRARLLLQMPTGSGKTETAIGAILAMRQQNPHSRYIWLTHRRELIEQTTARLQAAGINAFAGHAARWKAGQPLPTHTVMVTGPTVLKRREIITTLDPSWHLIVDEAHHAPAAVWSDLIAQFPGSVAGLTATPWRLSRKEGFDHLFGQLIVGPQVSELVADGYLANPLVIATRPDRRIQGGLLGAGGDYTASGIAAANSDLVLTQGAIDWWQDSPGAKLQTIFYAISIQHAYRLHRTLTDAGVAAAVVTHHTDEAERDKATKRFRAGQFQCLVNVAIYTEGADFPEADCIVLLRPTESLPLYLQMVGRGMRPGQNGHVLILDATSNTHRHGLPTQDREWSLRPRGDTATGEAPVKECHACCAMLPAATQVCPQCGKEFGKTCPRCGVWRGWQQWQSHNPSCDRCTREETFDHRHDTAPTRDDGWSVSIKGHPYIKTSKRRATLYRCADPNPAYILYLANGQNEQRINLGIVTEREAKQQAEAELKLSAVMTRRRIANCLQIITAATRAEDDEQRRQMLNEASVFASDIRADIATLPQNKTRRSINRYYDELVAAGAAARQLNESAAATTTPLCQD